MRHLSWIVVGAVTLLAGSASVVQATPTPVDGYGRTPAAARNMALDRAQEQVLELVRQHLGANWQPAPGQLDPDYLQQLGVIRPTGEPVSQNSEGVDGWRASYEVELSPRYLKELQHSARLERMTARSWLFARVLAGLVAVLLVTNGYLRLEQLTAGYYTRLLRVGAVALVALTGVALWLVR